MPDVDHAPVRERLAIGGRAARRDDLAADAVELLGALGRHAEVDAVLEDLPQADARLDEIRRQAEQAAIVEVADDHLLVRVEHAEPLRHVGDRRVEMDVAALQLVFGAALLGDVVMRRHPAAVGQRLVMDVDDAAVAHLDDRVAWLRSVGDAGAPSQIVLRRHVRHAARRKAQVDDLRQRHARPDRLRRDAVELGVFRVGDDEALVAVEEAEALAHLLQDEIEADVLGGQRLAQAAELALGLAVP